MKSERQEFFQSLQYEWACPITQQPMKDPVVTVDGHTYQRKAIIQWLNKTQTSPKTNLPLLSKQLIPNLSLRNVIKKFTQQHHQFLRKSSNRNSIQNFQVKQIQQYYEQLLQERDQKIIKLQEQISDLQKFINELLEQKHKEVNEKKQNIFFVNENPEIKFDVKSDKIMRPSRKKQFPQFQRQYFQPQLIWHKFKKPQQLEPYMDYLIKIFKNGPNIKQKFYQVHKYGQNVLLNHQNIPIDMKQFVKYDWKFLQFLYLKNTEMNDEKWRIFVQNAYRFPNLKQIQIYDNNIETVEYMDILQFPRLKQIWFYHNYDGSNPLSQQSLQNLRDLKKNNKKMQVIFQGVE